MVSYKDIYQYEENINYNELPLIFYDNNTDKDNVSLRESTLTRCITTSNIHEKNNALRHSFCTNALRIGAGIG